ncbi:uncharacterized protein LOC8286840 [Ricinus communis]|uniref:Uncharacterized protein n=1 Tax=Ricinus communis TaxID=3988 RepID=B9S9T6_RICCO|nr:uncharacterized protein LOC8286840 [Ricinus communis]EEF39606.1 conserved hypothetical protein [Ricinus communis]|eukprot:XP_025013791.1 uncharacterized protein LOC8286840 [Ricinus communis]
MLGKQAWNLTVKPYTLVSHILKAKYFPRGDFISAQLGSNPSSVWCAKPVLEYGCRWRVGVGSSISVWQDLWILNDNLFLFRTRVKRVLEGIKVRDFLIPGTNEWDVEMIHEIFEEVDVGDILKLPADLQGQEDKLIWSYDTRGLYPVKTGYQVYTNHVLYVDQQFDVLPWTRVWKLDISLKPSSLQTVNGCLSLLLQFKEARKSGYTSFHETSNSGTMHWTRPAVDVFKINLDAAIDLSSSTVGFEWVLRDHEGVAMAGVTMQVASKWEARLTEAW